MTSGAPRVLAAVAAAVIAAALAWLLVVLTIGWAGADETSLRIHLVVGAIVVGIAVGAASRWFSPSATVSVIVTGILVGVMYLPYTSAASPDWLAQLAAALLGAVASTILVAKMRTVDQ